MTGNPKIERYHHNGERAGLRNTRAIGREKKEEEEEEEEGRKKGEGECEQKTTYIYESPYIVAY